MLQRLFARYTGFLRSLKVVYFFNNLLNAGKLLPNRVLYRRYGLRKNVFQSIGSSDFAKLSNAGEGPWLDRPDALEKLEQHPEFPSFSPAVQNGIRQFIKEGYLIVENFFPPEATTALNNEVDNLLQRGAAGFNYTGRKIFNIHERSALTDQEFFRHPELMRLLGFLLGRPVIPFQSLSFIQGSEQRAHSDSIHMTTEPPGYLLATWIALEDCTADNGPLFYYPGSHRMPYVTTQHYDSGNTALTIGAESNRRYEDKIESLIQANRLEKRLFLAKRGDVLIWHANLLHGGSPILRPGSTRRSLVCHYYGRGVLCYHEISQRPALLPKTVQNGSN